MLRGVELKSGANTHLSLGVMFVSLGSDDTSKIKESSAQYSPSEREKIADLPEVQFLLRS